MNNPALELFWRLHEEELPQGVLDLTAVAADAPPDITVTVEKLASPPTIIHRVQAIGRVPSPEEPAFLASWMAYELTEDGVAAVCGMCRWYMHEHTPREESPSILMDLRVAGFLSNLLIAVQHAKIHMRDRTVAGETVEVAE